MRPILLYASEVWCPYIKGNKAESNSLSKLFKLESWDLEVVNVKFCKTSLGLSKYSSNVGARAEIGQYPIALHAVKAGINYFNRCSALNEDCLLKRAFLSHSWLQQNHIHNYKSFIEEAKSALGIHTDIHTHNGEQSEVGASAKKLLSKKYHVN